MFLTRWGSIDPALDSAVACLQEFKARHLSPEGRPLLDKEINVKEAAEKITRILLDKAINYQRPAGWSGLFQTAPTRINLRLQDLHEVLNALNEGILEDKTFANLRRVVKVAEAAVVIHDHANASLEAFFKAFQAIEKILLIQERCEFRRELLKSTRGIGISLEKYIEEKKPSGELKRRVNFLVDLIDEFKVPPDLFDQACYAAPAYLFRLSQNKPEIFDLDRWQANGMIGGRWSRLQHEFVRLAKLDLKRCEKPSFVAIPLLCDDTYRLIFSTRFFEDRGKEVVRYQDGYWHYHEERFATFDALLMYLQSLELSPVSVPYPQDDQPIHLEDQYIYRNHKTGVCPKKLSLPNNYALESTCFPSIYRLHRLQGDKERKTLFHFHPLTRRCTLLKPVRSPSLSWPEFMKTFHYPPMPGKPLNPPPEGYHLNKYTIPELVHLLTNLDKYYRYFDQDYLYNTLQTTQKTVECLDVHLKNVSETYLKHMKIPEAVFSSTISQMKFTAPHQLCVEEMISALQRIASMPSLNHESRKRANRAIEMVRICARVCSIYSAAASKGVKLGELTLHHIREHLFQPYFCFKLHANRSPYKIRVVRELYALGASLEQIAKLPDLEANRIAQANSLRDLIFAMNVPTVVLERLEYHGMNFILTQYAKNPEFFSKPKAERYPPEIASEMDAYAREYLQDGGFLLLPNFQEGIWSQTQTLLYYYKKTPASHVNVQTLSANSKVRCSSAEGLASEISQLTSSHQVPSSPRPPKYPFELKDSPFSSISEQPGYLQHMLDECLVLAKLKHRPTPEEAAIIAEEYKSIRPAFVKKALEDTRAQFPEAIPYCILQGPQGNEMELLFLERANQMRSFLFRYTPEGQWTQQDLPRLQASTWPHLLEVIFSGKKVAPALLPPHFAESLFRQFIFSTAFLRCAPDIPVERGGHLPVQPQAAASSSSSQPAPLPPKRVAPKDTDTMFTL